MHQICIGIAHLALPNFRSVESNMQSAVSARTGLLALPTRLGRPSRPRLSPGAIFDNAS